MSVLWRFVYIWCTSVGRKRSARYLVSLISQTCKFDITESSVQRIVRKHSGSIASLSKRLISWPAHTRSVEKGFHQMRNFPGVIGAIDGSHIEIKMPSTSGESYINRKGEGKLCFRLLWIATEGSQIALSVSQI